FEAPASKRSVGGELFTNAQTCDIEPTPPEETLLMCLLLYASSAFVMTVIYYLIALVCGGRKYLSYEMDGEGIARVKGDARIQTSFKDIRRIKTRKRRCEITLKTRTFKRKVYVFKEDFEEVLGYLKEKVKSNQG
ncbi:MAG: hypothetical protein MJ059_08135, partial [Lachnospiraceae bacterium]|nr:hypothetical protein [Lachnospiraceae bacterium]